MPPKILREQPSSKSHHPSLRQSSMVYRSRNNFTGFAYKHPHFSLHPSHSLLRYIDNGNYLLRDPDARSTKSFTITELAKFVDTNYKLQRGLVLMEDLPRGYILFANVYNKEPLVNTKFSAIDSHGNLTIGRGPSLKFLGISIDRPVHAPGYDGYEQIEVAREPVTEDVRGEMERGILGMVGGILQCGADLRGVAPFGLRSDLPLPIPLSRNHDRAPRYARTATCGRGAFHHGSGHGINCRGRNGGGSRSKNLRMVRDYRDTGMHDFAGRTPAYYPRPPSADVGVHVDHARGPTEDFVMDGSPAPDYSAIAGPSSYDPVTVDQPNSAVTLPTEELEADGVDEEGELTEDTGAAQGGDDTEDDEDV
ncbi:hypothetical protein PLEOSDRAFT_1099769 [Pleurotus ostreatus PC15]|uniref:Uncharacterized protein n=1 Tax=Pleurotus ostreatus (strain PC15) TaxID=1137138 RepID=A0A067P0J0_PLEO1|nr:hypothetical protein PLEOSDRAFT_1099769 [Pleurotus ostreatus PC15]